MITTANFPDMMLPAYGFWRFYGVVFVIYLLIGLFLSMNLLLGLIYTKFKINQDKDITKKKLVEIRTQFFKKKFYEYSQGSETMDKQ